MEMETIWSAYRARLQAFLKSRVSNPADVEDLLQEISIKVFKGLGGLEDDAKVQAWLFQTAHNAIIDHYRKNGRVKDIDPDDLWYADDEPGALSELERCVEPFVAALPAEMAELIIAVDLEGRPQKAVAEENGLPYSTLKSRVQAGRMALRAVFENCCHLSLDARGGVSDYRPKSTACNNC